MADLFEYHMTSQQNPESRMSLLPLKTTTQTTIPSNIPNHDRWGKGYFKKIQIQQHLSTNPPLQKMLEENLQPGV